jgi:aldose sugar dehydrogenase
MQRPAFAIVVALAVAACSQEPQPAQAPQTTGVAPAQTTPATEVTASLALTGEQNASRQWREFDSETGPLRLEVYASGLQHPWGLAFLPDGRLLVTERVGTLRYVDGNGNVSEPIAGVPTVVAEGQGGLLDVALSPDFASDGLVYLSYAEPGEGKLAGTAVARGRLTGQALEEVQVIFRQQPKLETRHHFGSRLVFDGNGHLFITLGDRGDRPTAQDLGSHMGTVARVNLDGSVPKDNPFVGRKDAQPQTWSYGHRNQQGAALNPWTKVLWTIEHGPQGGDELNLPAAGKNYGWPIITHGINYDGAPIPEAVGKEKDGMEPPHYVWEVSPGISGMAFYDNARVPAWQRNLFIGAMAQRQLIRLVLEGDKVVHEERLLAELGGRIRAVKLGPDGALYLLSDDPNGLLMRLLPRDASG